MQYIRRSDGNSDRRENARNGGVMKSAQTLLMSLCGLMLCLPIALNAEVKTDEQWKYSVTDDGVEILLYRGNDTSVCVPDTIEGAKVYSIGANAFKQKNVASIKIPEGVSSIGRSAFEGCRQLKEVELPNTLEKIDRWTFWDCKSLQVIQLPPNIKDPKIDAFKGCDSLREVHICNKTLLNTPPTTSTTDIRKMLGASAKVKIVQYDESRFEVPKKEKDEPAQSREVAQPNGLQPSSSQTMTIELVLADANNYYPGDLCFPAEIAATNITVTVGAEITLPTNIIAQAESFLADRFRNGKGSRMYSFEGWTGTYAQSSKGEEDDVGFGYKRGGGRFKKVRGGADRGLNYENGATFRLVSNLKLTGKWRPRPIFRIRLFVERDETEIKVVEGHDVTLPTDVVAQAMQKLSRERSVDGWKRGFDFVKWVTTGGGEEKSYENGATFTPTDDMTLRAVLKPHVVYCVSDGRLLRVMMNGHDTLVIPADVKDIGGNLLEASEWKAIKNVEIAPENKNLFLKNGVLCRKSEDSNDVVAVCLVKDCENLVIPEEVNAIGPRAFEGRSGISSVVIPAGVKEIAERAFGKTGIRKIDLPLELRSVGKSAFAGCDKLEKVVIPDGVSTIEPFAFLNCSELKSVAVGSAVTKVAESAFAGCSKLSSLGFSSSIDEVILEGLPDGIHITLPSTVSAFKLRTNDANKIEKFSLTITTPAGAVTREVVLADLGETQWNSTWSSWDWLRRQAELQASSADKEKARLYPAYTICDSHPKLYREFCAGADRLWCVGKLNEMGSDKNKIILICDEKFGVLKAVRVAFPSPGVSLEALLTKYKKQETGRFWVRGPKGDDELFYTGIIDKAKALFATNKGIVAGDDELMIALILSDDHWTENSKVSMIEVSSRKLGAALTELDRKEKAAIQEARDQAEMKAQKKLDSEALDF